MDANCPPPGRPSSPRINLTHLPEPRYDVGWKMHLLAPPFILVSSKGYRLRRPIALIKSDYHEEDRGARRGRRRRRNPGTLGIGSFSGVDYQLPLPLTTDSVNPQATRIACNGAAPVSRSPGDRRANQPLDAYDKARQGSPSTPVPLGALHS
jgi:hypothetical protein